MTDSATDAQQISVIILFSKKPFWWFLFKFCDFVEVFLLKTSALNGTHVQNLIYKSLFIIIIIQIFITE